MHHGLCESPLKRAKSLELRVLGLKERLNVAVTGARRPTLVAPEDGVKTDTWKDAEGAMAVPPVVK